MESVSSHHNRCDVHVILFEDHKDYHDECLDSLAGEPINLHCISGVDGDIGIGRYRGFSSGTAEFVSFVDDDDYIVPGVFQKCYDVMDQHPEACGVITKEQRLVGGELLPPDNIPVDSWVKTVIYMHHIIMVRREVVEPLLPVLKEWKMGSEDILWASILSSGQRFQILDDVGYIWRVHDSGAHKTINLTDKYRDKMKELYSCTSGE